jgi:hypothetical protein
MPRGKKQEPPSIHRLKVTIRDVRPPVWRRLEVPGDMTLASLHGVLQTAFGWTESHLHQFVVGDACYGAPHLDYGDWGTPMADERRVRLQDIVGGGVKRFVYEYDFGDGWEHQIVVEKVTAAETGIRYPRCTAGRRACPPEDCGGPWGYVQLLETIADPEHPEYDFMREWLGEEFDAEAFDLEAVNAWLQPRSRSGGR